MPLFQKSVLNKYLKAQDQERIDQAYQRFKTYFQNPETQDNIRKAKEEQFQQKFLIELFVHLLGYTINPDPGYNLTTEFKNEVGAKKADGAILKDGKAIAVIELKGTDTTDLDKINSQAFNYKNNQSNCIYVITSNFEKLRFFINNAVEHIEFNLFTLTEEEFNVLWLCLNRDNVFRGIPLEAKKESLLAEDKITRILYRDYAAFRNELWQDMVESNPGIDQLLLFKKTQKLLDRFLFIFFSEDKGLLPPNSISKIIEQWKQLKELDAYRPLYERFKKYFSYLDKGHKGKEHEIFAYNGGLFELDEVLDRISIDDKVLEPHVSKLTKYDFESEVDVNILGHIFEHSLSEIENIKAELAGQEVDKSKTKRKKEGIFYTPKYITKYIVDNTLGRLCEERKLELEISDDVYEDAKRRSRKRIKNLEAYRNWLLDLKICDPACGSGAFLNQALEFLINEHHYLDDLTAKYHGAAIVFPDVERMILENNLYGVDLNEESVEIAKLSLWLRTATKGRKLTTLSNHIKVGNSLIDDPEVAGEKAFNWKNEFSEVFDQDGFHVVIGNPPYVRAELLRHYRDYFSKHFKVFDPASDLFAYFYELGSNLIKSKNGLMGYISNTFDKTTAGQVLRKYLTNEISILNYVDFTEVQVFEGATTYPVIVILNKNKPTSNQFPFTKIPKASQSKILEIDSHKSVDVLQDTLEPASWSFLAKDKVSLFEKLGKLETLKAKYGKCYYGVKTALNEAFIVKNNWSISEHVKFIYEGKEIKKWNTPSPHQKLILFPSGWTKANYREDVTEEQALNKLRTDFPNITKHLMLFEERGKKRYDKGDFWWELRNCAYYDLFEKPKIIFPNLQNNNKFCLDNIGVFINAPAVFLPEANKTLLCILNSKVVWEFLKSICVVRSGGYIEVKPQYFEQIPIPELINEQSFQNKADHIISNTSQLQETVDQLCLLIQNKFSLNVLSKKLQNWPELEFADFTKELKKAKVKLNLSEEAEWLKFFNGHKTKAQHLKYEIIRLEREVDMMVYQLYRLTEEEIKIIEQN